MALSTTGYDPNWLMSFKRVWEKALWGRTTSGMPLPIALNNEDVTALNAAGTGTVALVKASATDTVVLPNGGHVPTGKTLTVDSGGTLVVTGTFTSSGLSFTRTLVALTTNGAVDPHTTANYVITKAGVLADTLAASTATTDDGVTICITSATGYAHTLTATGLFNTGAAAVNLATFAAFAGAGLTLMAYQGEWQVLCSVGVTFS